MTSLTPTGMPSTGEVGRPSRQRAVAASAASRARWTDCAANVRSWGSHSSSRASVRSRKSLGVSRPERKPATADWYDVSAAVGTLSEANIRDTLHIRSMTALSTPTGLDRV